MGILARVLPLIFLLLALSAEAQRQAVAIEEGKARLLQSIIDNTTWPGQEGFEHYLLGVYGQDRNLLQALNSSMPAASISGKAVVVEVFGSLSEARSAQVLVLAPSENINLTAIRQAMQGSQTLIVTDGAGDQENIMVNFTRPSPTRLSIEINGSNIVSAGLSPSKDLLLFGGSKLDLAEVYEETEAELARARQVAAEQQSKLDEQRQLLTAQGSVIERQRAQMEANQEELSALEEQLSGIEQLLAVSENRLLENSADLVEKEAVLAQKEASIASYSERIERNLQLLEDQKEAISEKERQIAEQDTVLMKQLGTIQNQRFILIAAATVLIVVLFLIGVIFRGYRSKHRLALQLEGKTLELGVANEKLVQLTEAKSLFLSSMSHEIRTPMNGVIGMAELLEGTDLTTQQSEYVSLIIKSADTLLGLINDILDFSKIEAGRLDLESIDFNLREVLGDTLQTLSLRANEKGLELTFHIPPDIPQTLTGDPLRLRQVMVNLVGNAIKFTEAGEVGVDVQLESVSGAAARVMFEVRDTGIGISRAQQEKIFTAFGQADSSTTRQFGGTGLGLAISRQLVEMMGGEMAVRSELGTGSTFSFGVDFQLPDEPLPEALQPEELQGLKALVVDDNATNRMILEELLVNWGMTACAVNSGEAALAELDKAEETGHAFAIALLDVMMPNMDGFELAAHIRQRPAQQSMRILMLSSAGRSNTEGIRERLDISRVLLKPVKQSDLQGAMTQALGGTTTPVEKKVHEIPEDLQPRRILLVEDNPVNQKVAVELLGRRSHRVEVVHNGQEAVDAVARQSFDLVLMDVHMPVMDGLTATRIIREREHDSGRHLPIIALTAGATVEDRENSLAVGMNGFVTKPFRAEELYEVVEGVAAQALGELCIDRASGSVQTVDPEVCLDWQGALRNLEGDEDFLLELSEMFLVQCPELLTAVEEAVSQEVGDDLRRAAHSLKGSSQVIGGKATAAAALRLENLGRDDNFVEAAPALRGLQGNLAELKVALAAALEKRDS